MLWENNETKGDVEEMVTKQKQEEIDSSWDIMTFYSLHPSGTS